MSNVSWKDTIYMMWENFTGVRSDGSAAMWRAFAFALLIAGTMFAVRCRMSVSEAVAGSGRTDGKPAPANEDALLHGMVVRARSIYMLRSAPPSFANAAENGEHIFDSPKAFAESPRFTANTAEVTMPDIAVRGIIILGGSRAAIVDIPGEEAGKIVKTGDGFVFMERSGRVTGVSDKGLSVRWNGLGLTFPLN